MKSKSSLKSPGTEQNRQRKKSDAILARRAHITVTEVRTFRALFPALFRRLERKAG